MKYVYLAGPISGVTYKECTSWRDWVHGALLDYGIMAISPMRSKEQLSFGNKPIENDLKVSDVNRTPAGITTRDHFDVRNADIVLAYMPAGQPLSLGTAIEIGWADMLDRPIILVSDHEAVLNHPMIDNIVGWKVPNIAVGVSTIIDILYPYTQESFESERQSFVDHRLTDATIRHRPLCLDKWS